MLTQLAEALTSVFVWCKLLSLFGRWVVGSNGNDDNLGPAEAPPILLNISLGKEHMSLASV